MTSLRELQKHFIQAIKAENSTIIDQIRLNTGRPNRHQLLQVYQNNYLATHEKALRAIYPTCFKLLGESQFEDIAIKYHRVHPSDCITLDDFGAHLGLFIGQQPELSKLPFLADIADLEWALHRASLGEKCRDFLSMEEFAQHFQQGCIDFRFALPDHATLIDTQYPLIDIWKYHYENQSHLDFKIYPTTYIITGHNGNSSLEVLDSELANLIKDLIQINSTLETRPTTATAVSQLASHLHILFTNDWLRVRLRVR